MSIGTTFAQFCVIIVWKLINPYLSADWRCRRNQGYDVINENIDDGIAHERIEDPEFEPLIICVPKPVTMVDSAKYTATITKVSA